MCLRAVWEPLKRLSDVLGDLESAKFSCVITDNALVMTLAWKIIEENYDHISVYGCAAHALNLLIKSIQTPASKSGLDGTFTVVLNNHHRSRAFLDEARKANKVRKLQTAVATRWFSHYESGMSVLNEKYLLIEICEQKAADPLEISPRKAPEVITTIKSDEF